MSSLYKKSVVFIFWVSAYCVSAQLPSDSLTDTISRVVVLPEFNVLELRTFKNKGLQRRYDRLVERVKRTYARVDSTGKRRDKKELIGQFEAELRQKYYHQLKRMSFADGRILLKLLDRQTEFTSYELLQEMKGGVQAFFWQGVAGMFDYDLKAEFNPQQVNEDKMIDEICRMMDSGKLK